MADIAFDMFWAAENSGISALAFREGPSEPAACT